ncbi:MAG TPA: hypothetical protein VF549_13545 [Solirubrobacteraceae bacterium]|jgi:hypothetical protein
MRRLPLCLVVSAAALLPPASAAAAVNTTKVTSPTDGEYFLIGDPPKSVTFSGQAPGAANTDKLDLTCIRHNESDYVFEANVAVSGGTFSVTLDDHEFPGGRCRVIAVPHGASLFGDLSKYEGPLVSSDWRRLIYTSATAKAPNQVYDWYELHTMADGYADFLSISDCGMCDSALYYADTQRTSNFVFWANALLDPTEPAPLSRSGARVDGRNAWGSYVANIQVTTDGANVKGEDLDGVPVLTYSRNGGGPDEDMEMIEEEDLVRCRDGDPWPVKKEQCGAWVPTGVRVLRRIVQTRGGKLVLVVDAFRSVDGREHALDLHWTEAVRPPNAAHASFQFPWAGDAYATHAANDKVPATSSVPSRIFVRTKESAPDGDRDFPQALVMYDRPLGESVFTSAETFVAPTELTVPAGGETTVRHAYGMATTRAELVELGGLVDDKWTAPAVEITGPAEAAVLTVADVDVTGRASDTSLASVTLNGSPVTVGADGRWTGRTHLAEGANTLTAVARDAQGNETTATRHVTFAPPPIVTPVDKVAPALSGVSLSARTFRVAAGATAVAAAAKRGTTVRYTLSEPATVSFAISRATKGRRVGGKCRRATRKNRRKRACTRYVKAGRTITRRSPAGGSTLKFTGRIGTKKLKPGRYRMAIAAADAAGNRSKATRLKFRIVRR